MMRKLILLLALARCLMCESTANDLTFTSAVESNANSIFNAFSPVFKPFWQYASETFSSYEIYLTSLIFRTEFFFAAIGEHVLPAKAVETTPEDDAQHHVTAMTAIELMKNLRTMSRVSEVLDNVTLAVGKHFLGKQRTGQPDHVHAHDMFEKVDLAFADDAEFQSVKRKLAQQFIHPMDANNFHSHISPVKTNLLVKIFNVAQDSQFLQLKLNTAFLRKSKTRFDVFSPSEYDKFTLANALMRLAQDSSYESRVQKLYNNALSGVLKHTNPWYRSIQATEELFAALQRAVESDVELKKAVDVMRKMVLISIADVGKYELDFLL